MYTCRAVRSLVAARDRSFRRIFVLMTKAEEALAVGAADPAGWDRLSREETVDMGAVRVGVAAIAGDGERKFELEPYSPVGRRWGLLLP